MAKNRRTAPTRGTTAFRSGRWPARTAIVAVAALGLGAGVWWWSPERPEPLGGTPRLVLDREVMDFGYVRFETPVRAVFRLTNAGSGVLRLTDVPRVQVLDGC